MNNQACEKQWRHPEGHLQIYRIWRTIQGEGPFVGMPAVFIRLAGCNLACEWCDTDYTSIRQELSPGEIYDKIGKMVGFGGLVVLTGGEPFRQNISPLVELLFSVGCRIQIETNGTLFLFNLVYPHITLVCSPKTQKINSALAPKIDAWKYVISSGNVDGRDGLPLDLARPLSNSQEIYVQPMDEQDSVKNQENMVVAVNSCLTFDYRLSLQIHKIVGVD